MVAKIHFTMSDSSDQVYVYETDCDEDKALRKFENMIRYQGPFQAQKLNKSGRTYHINPSYVTKWWLKP